jgi:hypothetical protein
MQRAAGKPPLVFILGTAALLVAGAISILPLPAVANSAPPGPDIPSSSSHTIEFLAVNFIINLFLFTGLFLLFASIWGKKVGKLDPNRDRFILLVLVGISLVTFLGLIIDYAFLHYLIMGWAFAAVLIFVSIYIVAYQLVKIGKRVSALIGIGMVVANLASWFYSISHHGETPVDPLLLLAILPLLLIFLYKWHRSVFLAK